MKTSIKILIGTMCLLLCGQVFAQNNVEIRTETLHLQDPVSQKNIVLDMEYPVYTQARLRILDGKLTVSQDQSNKKPKLIISGKIQNMLKRELRNAEITIEFIDKNDEVIDTMKAQILPVIIKKDDSFGRFSAEMNYNTDIISGKITITWQGKEED